MDESSSNTTPFVTALAAGGMAGFAVDVSLFPIDTVKYVPAPVTKHAPLPPQSALTPPARPRRTRLQSPQGFFKSGGFTGIYRGLSVAASGSVPGAALFFSSYETGKAALAARNVEGPSAHMTAASAAECVACLVRVPVEVVKQRMQAGLYASMFEGFPKIMAEAGVGGF